MRWILCDGRRRGFLIDVPNADASPVVRIALSALFSLVLHLALLFVPTQGGGALWSASQDGASPRMDALLKLDLVSGAKSGKLSLPRPVEQVLPVQNNAKNPASRVGAGLFSAPKPDQAPVLISEIDGAVESLGVKGKMILHLEVDATGLVEFSEVIYSELPEVVGREVQRRFNEARFRPAVRNGRVVDASVLLRIDVE